MSSAFDVVVVGAGFGGLGAALTLGELGLRVCLCETLKYPGGCASTFSKAGFRFDAGATLLSGLGQNQVFGRWLARYAPSSRVDWTENVIELRSAPLDLRIGRSRERLVEALAALPGAPERGIRQFFAAQKRAADALWPLLDDPTLLPPFTLATLLRHASRLGEYARVLPWMGRPLLSAMKACGVADFAPLRLYVDALCQITVQCSAAEAEAPIAFSAMDYVFRGTAHVHGGVGAMAEALLAGARRVGVDVRMTNRVGRLRHDPRGGWLVSARGGEIRARAVVANLLPSALERLIGHASLPEAARARQAAVDGAWGAAMLYAVAKAPLGVSPSAHHLQLVDDERASLCEGNHVFVSMSSADETERAPPGQRTITASTHVSLAALRSAPGAEESGRYMGEVQARMRRTLEKRAPEWAGAIECSWTASPRTFERFVGRPSGGRRATAYGGVSKLSRDGAARAWT